MKWIDQTQRAQSVANSSKQQTSSTIDGSLPARSKLDPLANLERLDSYLHSTDVPFSEISGMPVKFSAEGSTYIIDRPAGELWERSVIFARQLPTDRPLKDDRVVMKVTSGTPEEASNGMAALRLISECLGGGRDLTKFPALREAVALPSSERPDQKTMIAVMNFRGKSTLDTYVEQGTFWRGQAHVLEVAISATRGVELLHDLGIAHNDLFGRNVMVASRKAVRAGESFTSVIDFDLCEFLSTSPISQDVKTSQKSDEELLSRDISQFSCGVLGTLEFKRGLSSEIAGFVRALRHNIQQSPEITTLHSVERVLRDGLRCVRGKQRGMLKRLTQKLNSPHFDLNH
jgi:tRNA A-37 threonylcarbamoyl transferase component Bud32